MLPIIWLFGTSGVGKSTVGYRMLTHLAAAGVTAAFVDADQLRLASGTRATEADLIAAALPSLIHNYQAHDAQALIVAGLLDDTGHLTRLLPDVERQHVLTVHLEADSDTIRDRVHRRGWLTELADDAVDYAHRIAPDLADLRLNTTAQTSTELAEQVTDAALTHIRQNSPGHLATPARPPSTTATPPRRLMVITGPGGVGVSTAGFQTFSLLARAGEPVGYLDAHQLGFLGTDVRGDHLGPLRAANARAVTECLAHAGAQTVVISGDPRTIGLLIDTQHDELDSSDSPALFWLDASAAALAERLTARAQGEGPVIQGNHRIGLTGDALADAIARAVHASHHDPRPRGTRTIDTSDLDPRQVAEAMIASLPRDNRCLPPDS
ncbi:AAA family ATPase [Pseudonocardia sp. HH130630-07]|uniref:AAA family ATPase n=2 Tax=unclassified Pseudonocardia TaxID=2619320 RepID=UPI0012E9D63A|nr:MULTISPECIES: AAA family ATPase [unclassified Pseudonocardia]